MKRRKVASTSNPLKALCPLWSLDSSTEFFPLLSASKLNIIRQWPWDFARSSSLIGFSSQQTPCLVQGFNARIIMMYWRVAHTKILIGVSCWLRHCFFHPLVAKPCGISLILKMFISTGCDNNKCHRDKCSGQGTMFVYDASTLCAQQIGQFFLRKCAGNRLYRKKGHPHMQWIFNLRERSGSC